ncbi:ribosomal maturation YjgA family protein [Chryseobacterium oryctis]|uniref:DUF2809 domain-containing protein n=1 Tax=Chryseobacterium oryctis TaxID=2952618 RepID=A0ABT3HLI2_9FLAO|nr:DUF2809 domain-containing protein [Chryseobacterium oryctis]MCW3160631.1 DUF2809 domain-containing protein [Chryseobacterium oryctis]
MKLKFNLKYFIATILLFLIEVLIATKLSHLFFVRAYLGDVIVVILLYTFVKSLIQINNNQKLNLGIFLFSCVIEFAQYFHIAEKLGFKVGSLMYIVIGNSFSWIDILCYVVGCLFVSLFIKIND